MQLINIVIVSVIYFAKLAVLVSQCHSTLECRLALSFKVEVDSAHFFPPIVMQPFNFPSLRFLHKTHHTTLLPMTVSR